MKISRCLASPVLLSLVTVLVLAVLVTWRVADSLGLSSVAHRIEQQLLAELIAEEIAVDICADEVIAGSRVHVGTGGRVLIHGYGRPGEFELTVLLEDREFTFRSRRLEGGSHPAWAGGLSVGVGEPSDLPGVLVDECDLEGAVVAGEVRDVERHAWRATGAIVEHSTIGARWISGGTDALDFVLQSGAADWPTGRVVKVPGNLWIPPSAPVDLRLEEDLTIVAAGNLYLGAALRVIGVGRLTLVADTGQGTVFRDLDLDGVVGAADSVVREPAFGKGSREGTGSIQIGGLMDRPGATEELLRVDAGLMARGELRVLDPVETAGPVLARFGVRGTSPVVAATRWNVSPRRELLPGLAGIGPPRPAFLKAVLGPEGERAAF